MLRRSAQLPRLGRLRRRGSGGGGGSRGGGAQSSGRLERLLVRLDRLALLLALNNHHKGVAPDDFARSPALVKTFDVLSTNVDANGKAFVSSAEAKRGNLFAVQWHPEKNAFELGEQANGLPFEAINHGADAVAATAALAATLVAKARESTQSFPDRAAHLIYRCATSPVFYPAFQETYLFPRNWTGAPPAC